MEIISSMQTISTIKWLLKDNSDIVKLNSDELQDKIQKQTKWK